MNVKARAEKARQEIQKLIDAGVLEEEFYPSEIKESYGALWGRLQRLAKEMTGRHSPIRALKALGFTPKSTRWSQADIIKTVRQEFPIRLLHDVMNGVNMPMPTLHKITASDRGNRLYNALQSRASRNGTDHNTWIDLAFPDFKEKYGISPSSVIAGRLATQEQIDLVLEEKFYAAEDISDPARMISNGGLETRVAITLLSGNEVAQIDLLEEETLDYKGRVARSLNRTRHPELPVTRQDVNDVIQDGIKNAGTMAEWELLIALAIAQRYDPTFEKIGGGLARIVDGEIVHLDTHGAAYVGEELFFSDGRLEIDDVGVEKSLRLESKVYKKLTTAHAGQLLVQLSAEKWSDGKTIDENLLYLNLGIQDEASRALLGDINARVLMAEDFTDSYRQALQLLCHEDPSFFRQTPNVIHGDPVDNLLELHMMLRNNPQLLRSRAHSTLSRWGAQLLRSIGESVLQPQPLAMQREPIPFESSKSPYEFAEQYGAALDALSDRRLRDCVFFDLETTGFTNSGSMIVNLGVMRWVDGEWKATVYFARDPLEERELLEVWNTIGAQSPLKVGYNSDSFDTLFLNERMNAWRQRWDMPLHFVDAFSQHYREDAKRKGRKGAKLQYFERDALHMLRSHDVPGGEIPVLYERHLQGEIVPELVGALKHNFFDVISTAIVYKAALDAGSINHNHAKKTIRVTGKS